MANRSSSYLVNMGIIPLLVFMYIAYLHFWESVTGERAYVQLFNTKTYLIHLICAIVIAAIGFFCSKLIPGAQWMFSPLIFLIFFKPADLASLMVNKRHIMLTRMNGYGLGDVDPGQGFSDFALDFLISGITILMCLWIHAILHTQLF